LQGKVHKTITTCSLPPLRHHSSDLFRNLAQRTPSDIWPIQTLLSSFFFTPQTYPFGIRQAHKSTEMSESQKQSIVQAEPHACNFS
jgi:hypothetical protein